jgi:hypothetical protein
MAFSTKKETAAFATWCSCLLIIIIIEFKIEKETA